MRMWLDTEFNSFQGNLISIGIVAEDGNVFYEVRKETRQMELDPWVEQNVVPFLNRHPIKDIVEWEDDSTIQYKLSVFLLQYPEVEIIADWPEDIQHLCNFMITGPGMMINTPLKMNFVVDRSVCGESLVPHNAIYDAIGNMEQSITKGFVV